MKFRWGENDADKTKFLTQLNCVRNDAMQLHRDLVFPSTGNLFSNRSQRGFVIVVAQRRTRRMEFRRDSRCP